MTDQLIGAHNAHNELHSEQGARPGEHRGARPTRSSRSTTFSG
jgi:hypothetical protein